MTHRARFKLLATIAWLGSTASADVINVPDDYPTIQQAIDAAIDGDEIIVSPGLYFENIDFLDKDLTVRSTDPNDPKVVQTTIIDGLLSGTVVTMTGGIIQGFTIRNGFAQFGGGVDALIDAEIRDNIIIANTATFSGGGIYADGDVVIDNNSIVENIAENNSGGGIFALTRTIITRNRIVGNLTDVAGGGIRAFHNCHVRQNMIAGNAATRGGGAYLTQNVTAKSNLISGNSADTEGGGINAEDHFGVIASNTLIGNTSGSTGSGLFADGGVISSNIVAFSPSFTVAIGGGSEADVDYNCVFGNNGAAGAAGDNDVLADPEFVAGQTGMWTQQSTFDSATNTTILTDSTASYQEDFLIGQLVNPDTDQDRQFAIISNTQTTITVAGNAVSVAQADDIYQIFAIHLSEASPCVGAGDPTQTGEFYVGSDIDGEARIQDCAIDIGADEVTGVPTIVLSITSTMTTPTIEVSVADCNRRTNGEGSFNRFYLDAPLVTLTAEEEFAGLPFRWVIDGQEQPFGELSVTVELTDHVTALARYFPVVNISRDTYFTGVQDAIVDFATADGDEIVVFPSVYVENIDFLDKIILVRSIDPLDDEIVASTVIDGNMEDTVVTLAAGEISGFTIRNGRPFYGAIGGGVRAVGSAIVSHNVITENTATNSGAGVEAENSVVVRNNTIINNFGSADGSGVSGRDNVIITENTIAGNTTSDDGGGVEAEGNCLVIDNVITGNQARSGGGVYAQDDSIVTGNMISDNIATNRGGGVYAVGEPTIQGNRILNNESQDGENGGGGIYGVGLVLIADNAVIYNTSFGPGGGLHLTFGADAIGNTIVNNIAVTTGGGIFASSLNEHFLLLHNIVTFNAGTYGIYSEEPIEIDYNCVFGNDARGYGGLAAPGPHDINVDPWLADDLIHLLPGSPCVNAGDPAFIGFEGQTDIDGDPRVLDERVDIGADETRLGDLNGDGVVGAVDLLILLVNWGVCAPCIDCPADLDDDCTVGATDLLILLVNWG